MYDLLDSKEDKEAASLGWSLNYVYDLKTSRWLAQVFPLTFTKPFHYADAMATHVVSLARVGHPLAIKALRFVAEPVTRRKKK